ncbi:MULTISPECIES: ABC transporter ATP-binding protein [Brevibacillus]|uniref:ABC transporter ATP-binding protein n=1 Tax=Brevibacillus invocatus TaxID=173959 RepID=A0A3M8CGT5_9BACL|nr:MULTISPECIES: ABC transporter ATP-binding protein [Brevibacillus]MDH4616328.1 ABC transporter ATP-binding protein [Brevibacillus sp. AY1]RNB74527.1 ABC transporter ATP-binding protein [Brevibacillus invocatus]
MAEVELRRISKMYEQQKVVNEVSAVIEPGEFFVLVGPSGCGKSTTLRMIAGLEEISGGDLLIGGKQMNHTPPSGRNISMVFQNYALYPHLTVKENILFGLQVRKVNKQEQIKRLNQVAEMLGIAHLLQRKPRELSGGQRQRVALGRAIVSQHPICLMDEPLSNLDAKLRGHMRTEIRRLQQELGITMIYVTHDQVEAMTMGDRMMVLRDGEVQQVGRPLDVYNHPANLFVAEFTGAPPMNTVQAVWRNNGDRSGVELTDQGSTTFLPLGSFAGIKEGAHVVLGVRPEALQPVEEGQKAPGSGALAIKVQGVEILGSETIVEFTVSGKLWKAKWNGQWTCKRGDILHVGFHAEQARLFDGNTGKNLANVAVQEKGEIRECVQ